MYLLGGILKIFSISKDEDIIITDFEASTLEKDQFKQGMTIQLRNRFSEQLCLTILSAELATNMGKNYLAFIIEERLNQQAMRAFDQIFTPVKI
jgi:hypothetical protein